MIDAFERVIDNIIRVEGRELVDHPSDRGGPTKYGITQAVARANGWKGPMRDLPEALAREIYMGRYITIPQFDKVYALGPAVGSELIDTGVNMGPAVAAMFFQRWLNGFNARGSQYADLFADGRIGRVTLDAFRSYLKTRGQEGIAVMVAALNSVQGSRYLDIAERNETQEDFLYGWIRARVLQAPQSVA